MFLAICMTVTSLQSITVIPAMALMAFQHRKTRCLRSSVIYLVIISFFMITSTTIVNYFAINNAPPPRSFSLSAIVYTFYTYIVGYSFGPSLQDLQTTQMHAILKEYAPHLAVVGILLLSATLAIAVEIKKTFSQICLPLALVVTSICYGLLIEFGSPHSYHVRYTLTALPAVMLLFGSILDDADDRVRPYHSLLVLAYGCFHLNSTSPAAQAQTAGMCIPQIDSLFRIRRTSSRPSCATNALDSASYSATGPRSRPPAFAFVPLVPWSNLLFRSK